MEKVSIPQIAGSLAAIVPQVAGGTAVYLADGRVLPDSRQVRALVVALARHYAVDIIALRQRCRAILYARNYTPLPLAPDLVLVPLALATKPRLGYVNYSQVVGVSPGDEGCNLLLEGDLQLPCYQGLSSVQSRMQKAQLVMNEMGYTDRDRELRMKLELLWTLLAEKF